MVLCSRALHDESYRSQRRQAPARVAVHQSDLSAPFFPDLDPITPGLQLEALAQA